MALAIVVGVALGALFPGGAAAIEALQVAAATVSLIGIPLILQTSLIFWITAGGVAGCGNRALSRRSPC